MPDVHARLAELERRLTTLEANMREDFRDLSRHFDEKHSELTKKVDATNGALMTAALSLAGGLILLAVSILLATKWLAG